MEKLSIEQRFVQIEENLKTIRENIARAAEQSGRKPQDVALMAVTKTVEPVFINHVLSLGVDLIGENKVQEFLEKKPHLQLDGCRAHLIGHLQTNKVKKIVGEVCMIQSVDSMKLAQEVGKQSVARALETDVLLEVNIGGEASKTGFLPEETAQAAAQIGEIPGVRVQGLMAIPPACGEEAQARVFFSDMRKLFIDISSKKLDNVTMSILSMGMSGDYQAAILEGANLVRIGSSLFGGRKY